LSELVLTWSIARAAAKACRLVETEAGPVPRLEIVIGAPREHASATVQARILDGTRAIPLQTPPTQAQWIQDSIAGVWHLDIDGILKLTVRQSEGRIEALYARTELLTRTGLAGGRYEFDGASLRER